jgi:hypothetical protein
MAENMSKYHHTRSICQVLLLTACSVISLSGCNSQSSEVPRLRVINTGAFPIHSLVVIFPEDRIEFGDIPAGAATEYKDVPHGVFSYAAYQFEVDGQVVELAVLDWVGEKPMSGISFTCEVNFDPGNIDPEGGIHPALIGRDD